MDQRPWSGVNASKPTLLTTWLPNRLRDQVWMREIQLYWESQQPEKTQTSDSRAVQSDQALLKETLHIQTQSFTGQCIHCATDRTQVWLERIIGSRNKSRPNPPQFIVTNEYSKVIEDHYPKIKCISTSKEQFKN